MRGKRWLGLAASALLVVLVAVMSLGGTAPSNRPAAVTPIPAAQAPPAKPPGVHIVRPSFDIVRVDPQGQAVIAGRAAPGDRVQVLDSGKPLGEVTADARGEWVLVPDAPLAPGNRQLVLEATDKAGGPVRRSTDVVALSVIPSTGAVGSPSTLAVLLPGDADKPARVLQQATVPPKGQGSEGQKLSLETAEYGANNRLMLSGQAESASRLKIYADDRLLGTVTADSAGKWSLTAAHPAPARGVELRLDEIAADGTVAHWVTAPFEAFDARPLAAGGSYVVGQGNSLWVIARDLYGNGFRYTAIYAANRDQIRDPNRIYPGQTFKLPKS